MGVFRDEAPQRVLSIANHAGLRAVQLHGREPVTTAQWLADRVPMVIQALPAGDVRVGTANEFGAHVIMLDAPHPGSGQVFDWALAGELPAGQRLLIAGGLTAANVAAAIARTHPWGVDAVSGVEGEPGRKDPIKLRDFIAAARTAEAELAPDDDAAEESPYDWQEDR